jgi:hypothetical protein
MIRARTPLLGEHNEKILGNYLGYSADKVASLTKAGILVQEPRVAELRADGRIP